jgi:hypothetical protein
MIPSTISATLSADLVYNPSVHVQTVEIDRTGINLIQEASDSFVKWYLRLSDFKKLCWNTREMTDTLGDSYDYGPAGTDVGVDVFSFAREATNPEYLASDASINAGTWTFSGVSSYEHAETGTGVCLVEASGGAVRFPETSLTFNVALASDATPGTVPAGEGAIVGATSVTYDRALLDSAQTGSVAELQSARSANQATNSATSTTWSFDTSSFAMTVKWSAAHSGTSHDASMTTWGHNQIYVYADPGANIAVTKPYNDAAADFIQIGMDASGGSSTFANTSGAGQTLYDVHSHETTGSNDVRSDGLVDAGVEHSMTTSSIDRVTSSIDYASYLSDYTLLSAPDAGTVDAKRNYINVEVGEPTVAVTNDVFTQALQQAINQDGTTRNVSGTKQLRAAIGDAFAAGHLLGFQGNTGPSHSAEQQHGNAVELPLPFTVAGEARKVLAQSASTATSGEDYGAGTEDKKLWLTPIIKLVEDSYTHLSWFHHRGHGQ